MAEVAVVTAVADVATADTVLRVSTPEHQPPNSTSIPKAECYLSCGAPS